MTPPAGNDFVSFAPLLRVTSSVLGLPGLSSMYVLPLNLYSAASSSSLLVSGGEIVGAVWLNVPRISGPVLSPGQASTKPPLTSTGSDEMRPNEGFPVPLPQTALASFV